MRDSKRYTERIIDPCMEMYEKILWEKKASTEEMAILLQNERGWLEKESVLAIPRISIIVTTRCTLRCVGCSQLIPSYKKTYDVDLGEIISCMSIILCAVDKCYAVDILGGEAFLVKEIKLLVEWLKKQEKILQISFTTNGTVLPDEQTRECLCDEKVLVRISDYGMIKRQSAFLSELEKAGVHVAFETGMKWKDAGEGITQGRSQEELKLIYKKCNSGKVCKTLLNGKVYHCSRCANLYDLEMAFFEKSRDAFEVDKTEDISCLRKRLERFFLLDYSNACDNCNLRLEDEKYIPAGVQENTKKGWEGGSAFTIISRRDYEVNEKIIKDCRKEIEDQQHAITDLKKMDAELRAMLADAGRQIEEWRRTCTSMEADAQRVWDECVKTQKTLEEELRKKEEEIESLKNTGGWLNRLGRKSFRGKID